MTANPFDGKKIRSLDNIIAKLSKVRTPRKGNRILLVSEKNNACLSLSSEESEDGEADLHQCGHCRRMFTNLSLYITHKIEKPCRAGPPNRDGEWPNDAISFNNETNAEDQPIAGQANEDEKDRDIKVLNQESQKRKHDRKGLARRLNVTGSPDSADPMSSPDDVDRVEPQILPPSSDTENPVIVVVNEPGTEKEAELESRLNGNEDEDRNKDGEARRLSPIPHSKKLPDNLPPDMPFLERIRSNNPHEGMPAYPPAAFPNFPPRITDKMQNMFPPHGEGIRENYFPGDRIPIENHRDHDMRKSWPEINKKNLQYTNHIDNDIHGCYPPQLPHPLYNAPFPSMPYSHPYMRHSNSNLPHGKPCRSSEHTGHPNYAVSSYTMSHMPADRANRKIYEVDPSVYTAPYSSSKAGVTHDDDKKQKDETDLAAPDDLERNKPTSPSPKEDDETAAENSEQVTADGADEDKTNTEANVVSKDDATSEEQRDDAVTGESKPQLLSMVGLYPSKEHIDSPSSLRPESFETNSQTGSFDSTPTSSMSDSPQSSSNQSIDPTISPSQVYDGGVLQVAPDSVEDGSKQSIDSESTTAEQQEKRALMKNSGSPSSDRYVNDSNLGEREDAINQGIASFKHKRPRSVDIAADRPHEENQNEVSSPPSDPSWRHSKQVYRCPLCAKIFPFKSKLQRHVLVHTGIKPYKCSVCGRGFTQQIDLQRHITRHTGEKPFKCHLCKAQFIRADNLRKHCKDTHFVNIEEPIRKRRRKTTGSDTVLPPLEVAIAMAINETEKNGGRVLGRSSNRNNSRNPRRDRMLSMEEEQRRMEQSSETFSRPTMGALPSHPFPGGPPTMGFPHGPGMPPFSRHPSELYDPGMDRPTSPPHPIMPPRYHPGSMVFQPRSMADRYLERPYFSRPPNELPAMYWSSAPHISPPGEGQRIPPRERFNSETSEGASSVFETRDDGKNQEAGEGGLGRGNSMVPSRSEARFMPDGSYIINERIARSSEGHMSEERISVVRERVDDRKMLHPPDLRMPHEAGNRSPHRKGEEKGSFIPDRRSIPGERGWPLDERMRPPVEQMMRAYDERVFRVPDDAMRYEERRNRSPNKVSVSQNSQRQLSPAARFKNPDEPDRVAASRFQDPGVPVVRMNERGSGARFSDQDTPERGPPPRFLDQDVPILRMDEKGPPTRFQDPETPEGGPAVRFQDGDVPIVRMEDRGPPARFQDPDTPERGPAQRFQDQDIPIVRMDERGPGVRFQDTNVPERGRFSDSDMPIVRMDDRGPTGRFHEPDPITVRMEERGQAAQFQEQDAPDRGPGPRFQDSDIPIVGMDDRGSQGGDMPEEMRMHLRLADPWSRYERNKLDVSPKKLANYNPDNSIPMNKVNDVSVSVKEEKNGFRTPHEEFRIVSS